MKREKKATREGRRDRTTDRLPRLVAAKQVFDGCLLEILLLFKHGCVAFRVKGLASEQAHNVASQLHHISKT